MPQERFSISQISEGLTISAPDGKPITARLYRAQRRNIARLLYRQRRPPKIDPVEIGFQVAIAGSRQRCVCNWLRIARLLRTRWKPPT